jgi:hypothetical protein
MPEPRHTYRFGPFRLDVAERRLTRDGEALPLRLKVPCGSDCWRPLRVAVEREPSPDGKRAGVALFLEELGRFLGWDTVDQSP